MLQIKERIERGIPAVSVDTSRFADENIVTKPAPICAALLTWRFRRSEVRT
jgi:hypothetical protein